MTTDSNSPDRLAELTAQGVSLWLDDLSRQRLQSGNLQQLIDTWHISGVTTNPSIFQAALKDGASYQQQLDELAARGAGVDDTVREVTTDDVRDACDLFTGLFQATGHVDGRVSIEVDPRLAHETQATIDQAARTAQDRRPAQRADQDPGHPGRAARDHRRHRRGHQRQRHPDLLPGPVQGRHGRLPGRPGTGRRGRPRPGRDPFRRLVLRLPGGHRDRQATEGDRLAGGGGPARARPPSPTPGWPTRPTSRPSPATAGRRWPPRARTSSGRCGRPPASRTRSTTTPATSSSSSPRTR